MVRGLGRAWLDLRGLSYLQFPVRRGPEPSDCALIYRSSPGALVEPTAFGLIAGVLVVSALAAGLVERAPLSFPMLLAGGCPIARRS